MARSSRRRNPSPRTRRVNGSEHTNLQARVVPEAKALADAGAEARGITLSRYIEELVSADKLAQEFLESKQRQQTLGLEEIATT